MPKATRTHTDPTPTTLRENAHSTPTSPLSGEEIQALLDAIHDTSGLLAVQHQLADSLDDPREELQPLLRHGMFVLTNVVCEHFGEVEMRIRALAQEIGLAVQEGAGGGASGGEGQ